MEMPQCTFLEISPGELLVMSQGELLEIAQDYIWRCPPVQFLWLSYSSKHSSFLVTDISFWRCPHVSFWIWPQVNFWRAPSGTFGQVLQINFWTWFLWDAIQWTFGDGPRLVCRDIPRVNFWRCSLGEILETSPSWFFGDCPGIMSPRWTPQ